MINEAGGPGVSLLEKPHLRSIAMARTHCNNKGEPGITVKSFRDFINGELLRNIPDSLKPDVPKSIVWETAGQWLYALGCKVVWVGGKPKWADGKEREPHGWGQGELLRA